MSKKEILWTSKYWREWAKEARTKAAETKDLAAKAALEQKAAQVSTLGEGPDFKLIRQHAVAARRGPLVEFPAKLNDVTEDAIAAPLLAAGCSIVATASA